PVILGGRFLAELRAAPGEIHLLDHRFEWEPVARKQLLYFAPAVERAESIEMLQKKVARLQRFFERNGIERFLIFAFAIQPGRQRFDRPITFPGATRQRFHARSACSNHYAPMPARAPRPEVVRAVSRASRQEFCREMFGLRQARPC